MTTLVIGARGGVGRHVLNQLVAPGEPVRASVRDLATAGDLPEGVDVVAADLTKPETLKPALASSGLRCTPVRPLVLAGNALNWAHAIRRDGTVAIAYPDAVTAPVHERDIAAMAVAALTGSASDDVSGLLTGPELLSQRRQVELIGEAIGRPLAVEELSEAQARDRFSRFMPPEIAQAIIEYLVHATEEGGSPATDTALRVLGRPPLPFRQWAADHTADFN